uniref:TTF-type domain-containing protein n=1 Tax=Latimeria chalumnae TaxID=7897 RepID=H2ZUD4_LATCH
WLEYSQKADAAFCFPCRKFGSSTGNADLAFTFNGYSDWKHATESNEGLNKHSSSKEYLNCMMAWKERKIRSAMGKEVSTLVNSDQLAMNRYYLSSIIEIVEFLAINELPFRGSSDSIDNVAEGSCGLFLSLFEYTLRKDPELAKVDKTIPGNAKYTCHDIQNEIIEIMSDTVKEEIVREIGNSWYTVKVDGTRDPTGCGNISIVIRFLAENYDIKERLLTRATTDAFDALSLTNTVIAEITKAGISTSKMLSQCYDGASLMSGRHGGVQKLMQEKLEREIPYIHCFNHQLHLVIVHAMSSERGVEEFFNVCDSLYKFIR